MLIRRIARPMLSATFIMRGVEALRNPKPAADAARPAVDLADRVAGQGGPPMTAERVAQINAFAQIGGGLLLATGKLPRLASAVLAASVVPGSLGTHPFWSETDPQRKAQERREFATDVSLVGGLIIAALDTEGRPSLGWRGRRAAKTLTDTVAAALPIGAAAAPTIADKVGHGLHVGADRARELADIAREQGGELAELARERAADLAEVARTHGPEIADAVRERSSEVAEAAKRQLEHHHLG